MLGSRSEAEDAVQEAWLRLSRSDTEAVENLAGWLTTVVARVCLDMLRSRRARREDYVAAAGADRHDRVTGRQTSAALPTPSGWRCWWCSTRSLRPSALPSSCMTCSASRSTRSRRSWIARTRRRVSSRVGRGAEFAVRRRGTDPDLREQRRGRRRLPGSRARAGDFEGLIQVARPGRRLPSRQRPARSANTDHRRRRGSGTILGRGGRFAAARATGDRQRQRRRDRRPRQEADRGRQLQRRRAAASSRSTWSPIRPSCVDWVRQRS